MPKISVIIPVYNSAQFLDRCIKSILRQKLTDFELILIDDGSTDPSREIIDRYVSLDSRIRAEYKQNSGVSATRNLGIELARGEWITFVDSDDYVFPDYLSDMYEMAVVDSCDIVITGSTSGPDYEHTYADTVICKDNIHQLISTHKIHQCCPVWGKLFRASLIKDKVRFNPSSSWSEDILFMWCCLPVVNKVRLSSKINYFYEIHPDSVSKYIFSHEREAGAFVYANGLHSLMKATLGDEFVIKHFGLNKFLSRAVLSLYSGKYSMLQRMRLMRKIRFNSVDIEYSTTNRVEVLYKYALKHKIWLIVDILNTFIVPKMNLLFKG